MVKSFSRSKKRQERITNITSHIILILAVIIVLVPFSIVIALSLQSHSQAVNPPFRFFEKPFGLNSLSISFKESYLEFLKQKEIWNGLKNTLIIVVPIMLIIIGMLDFAKAVTEKDDGKIKDAEKKLINRAIAAYFSIEKNDKAMYTSEENYKEVKKNYLMGEVPIAQLIDAQQNLPQTINHFPLIEVR